METLFKYEGLTIARSGDVPGALVIGVQDWEDEEVFHQILPPEGRTLLSELLGADIFGQYTYGALKIVKHPGGWLEVRLATWRDPEPVAVVPEHISDEVFRAVYSCPAH